MTSVQGTLVILEMTWSFASPDGRARFGLVTGRMSLGWFSKVVRRLHTPGVARALAWVDSAPRGASVVSGACPRRGGAVGTGLPWHDR